MPLMTKDEIKWMTKFLPSVSHSVYRACRNNEYSVEPVSPDRLSRSINVHIALGFFNTTILFSFFSVERDRKKTEDENWGVVMARTRTLNLGPASKGVCI